MRTIKLIDMTLRETGAIRDNTLSFKEKLEIARILDRLKADVIELPPLSGSKADQLSNPQLYDQGGGDTGGGGFTQDPDNPEIEYPQ